MKKRFFGTDGIRGTAYQFPMNYEFLSNLANAIKVNNNDIKNVLIGMDTRESCGYIKDALVSGFDYSGVSCDCIEIVSTPILCFYTEKKNYDLGIMISASHNPYKDNGIKIFKKNGEKLSDQDELDIESLINFSQNIKKKKKKLKNPFKNLSDYENFILGKVILPSEKKNKKITLDCANGSLSNFAPRVFSNLDYELNIYGCSPNGNNINKNCGALEQKKLSKMTVSSNSQVGISFDGDADRVIISDHEGNIVDGDYILAIIAYYLFKKDKEMISVVGTKMSNISFRNFIKQLNFNLHLTNVGDRYVVEKMKDTNAIIGGEQSGHIIFSNNNYCGDGMLTALYVLNVLEEENTNLLELCKLLFKKCPQKLINFRLNYEFDAIINLRSVRELIKKYEGRGCDILLRKSGTENVLRLMIQSTCENDITKFIETFTHTLEKLE